MTVWMGASPGARNARAGEAMPKRVSPLSDGETFQLYGSLQVMSTTNFPSAAYDLSLIPSDDEDLSDHDAWADYCAEAAHVDRQRVLECVLSALGTDDSPLYTLIDTGLKDPHEPGRARESLTVLAAVGQAILDRVASAIDAQVNLRLAIGGTAC